MSELNRVFKSCFAQHSSLNAIHTVDGQNLNFERVEKAVSQIAFGMSQRGVKAGDNVICLIDNYAINLCTWFAVWRLGCNLLASNSTRNFEGSGIRVDAALMVAGQDCGTAHQLLFDQSWMAAEFEEIAPTDAGSIYFPTTHTPRELRVLRMGAGQLLEDAKVYAEVLGNGQGPVYMSTPVDSMRSFRDIFRAFLTGRSVLGPDTPLQDAWQAIKKSGATELFLSPISLHRLTEAAARDTGNIQIERIFVATGTAQQHTLERASEVFENARLELGAGTPETSFFAFKIYDPATHKTGQIGKVVGNLVAEIRQEDSEVAPVGEQGSLAIWVPPSARLDGYLNHQPAYDEAGWCAPGFLATMDTEGNITKVGRTDDRINIGGARYFSGKIEAVVDQIPLVKRSAVIRVFSEDGAEAMGVVVEVQEGFDAEELTAVLKRGFKFVGDLCVKSLDSIPVDSQGNPDRQKLETIWYGLD